MSTAGGTVAAAAIANAIKTRGVVVNVKPEEFAAVLRRTERPLVIASEGGVFFTSYRYLTSYKGIVFYTKARASCCPRMRRSCGVGHLLSRRLQRLIV
jgi:hypothetical protein